MKIIYAVISQINTKEALSFFIKIWQIRKR